MSTLVTPSAKSHERVKGRWVRDIQVGTRKDWLVYYAKQIVGTPVPWLVAALVCLTFLSRAGLEIAAWACATLTIIYIGADRFSKTREFSFFRIGSDFFLLGFVLVTAAASALGDSPAANVATLGGARWVILLYALTYCWELFPGLNRIFFLMMGMASVAAIYGICQHFQGLDLVRGIATPSAPTPGHPYFMATGFFGTPELLGTILATILPLPAAAFLLDDERSSGAERWLPLVCVLLFGLAIFWTYRPGLWLASSAGLVVTALMQGKQVLKFFGIVIVFFAAIMFIAYSGQPDAMLDAVQKAELERSAQQRAQINTQVALWESNTWIGVGAKAETAAGYDPGTGNVYFHVLAQSGVLGAAFYLLFILGRLLSTYRIFSEIPQTHYWHRVLVSGGLGSQVAFHMAGLYWSTLTEALAINLFILITAALCYLSEHYSRGLVPDDFSL